MIRCVTSLSILLASVALAQTRSSLDSELTRMQTELSRNVVLQERLVDLCYRQAMGLPITMDDLYTLSKKEWEQPRDQSVRQLGELQQSVAALAKEYEALQAKIRQDARTSTSANAGAETAAIPPAPAATGDVTKAAATGTPRPGPKANSAAPIPTSRPGARRPWTSSSPGSATESPESAKDMLLIKGSKNHGMVGQILFRAGKYEAAIRELLPLSTVKQPALNDLFYLALSYEKLGYQTKDHAWFDKANDIFSKIEAMDQKDGPDGKSTAGKWAQSARTARQTMFWILDSGEWKPIRDVDKIRWRDQSSEDETVEKAAAPK